MTVPAEKKPAVRDPLGVPPLVAPAEDDLLIGGSERPADLPAQSQDLSALKAVNVPAQVATVSHLQMALNRAAEFGWEHFDDFDEQLLDPDADGLPPGLPKTVRNPRTGVEEAIKISLISKDNYAKHPNARISIPFRQVDFPALNPMLFSHEGFIILGGDTVVGFIPMSVWEAKKNRRLAKINAGLKQMFDRTPRDADGKPLNNPNESPTGAVSAGFGLTGGNPF